VDHQFIPGDIAAQRLVRIGNKAGLSLGRKLRRNRIGVGTVFIRIGTDRRGRLVVDQLVGAERMDRFPFRFVGQGRAALARQRLVLDQRLDRVVQAEEKRRTQHEAGGDILAIDGEQSGQLHLFRMLRRISVETRGIAVEDGADIRRQINIFASHRAPHVEQRGDIVDRRAVRSVERRHPPAGHRGYFLQGRKIILRMGIGHAIGDIGIGPAENMRHAEFVADDAGLVDAVRRCRCLVNAQWFPQRQTDRRQCNKNQQTQPRSLKYFHLFVPLRQHHKLPCILCGDKRLPQMKQ